MIEAAIKVQGTVFNVFLLIFSGPWAVGAVLLLQFFLTPSTSLPCIPSQLQILQGSGSSGSSGFLC